MPLAKRACTTYCVCTQTYAHGIWGKRFYISSAEDKKKTNCVVVVLLELHGSTRFGSMSIPHTGTAPRNINKYIAHANYAKLRGKHICEYTRIDVIDDSTANLWHEKA